MSEHYIEDDDLAVAWARAVSVASARGRTEVCPLVVSITGFDADGRPTENPRIRKQADLALVATKNQPIETVASTIFPASMWNRGLPRSQFFERYRKLVPHLRRADKANSRGIYFERMVSGGPVHGENQIDFALAQFERNPSKRRSAFQIATFNPKTDHSGSALLGFPCLQHVTFTPTNDGLNVNAFYATQYLVERGYGNYLGLARLGQFLAHEMRIPLRRLTCLVGVAQHDTPKAVTKKLLLELATVLGERAVQTRGAA